MFKLFILKSTCNPINVSLCDNSPNVQRSGKHKYQAGKQNRRRSPLKMPTAPM